MKTLRLFAGGHGLSEGVNSRLWLKRLSPAALLAALLSLGGRAEMHAQPAVSASAVGGNVQIVWPVGSNYDSQVETSGNFLNWQRLWPPYPAPEVNGFKTNLFSVSNTFQFFRVRYGLLTNSPVPVVPGVYASLSFGSEGLARTYRLHIPTNYNAARPAPLAFLLHGHGQTADEFATQHPALAQNAQAAGMILVFPQSTSTERGTGWVDYDPAPGEPYVSDVQFLLELFEHLAAALNIDRQRVFAAGFSNGGQMVHYLGARTTNVFAAYATVASSIGGSKGGTNIVYVPPPSEPVSILIVNATNDCRRPYWGGSNGDSLQAAALEQAYHWASNNGCLEAPVVLVRTQVINAALRPNHYEDCPDLNPPPGTPWTNVVIRTTWMGGTDWTEVAFVELSDGGHTWPDAGDNVGFDANDEVIRFFLRHCRCDATGATNHLVVPTTPGQYDRAFCDQGYWRRFRLQIPASYSGANARALIFALHGGDETMPEFAANAPGLFTKCNLEGVLLVLPEATENPETSGTLWNNKPVSVVVDDRAFLTNLLEQLDGRLNIERRRVYLCGFSNGGRMGFWLSATWTNVLAAIGAVGSMTGWNDRTNGALVAPPAPAEPVPVHMTRGTLDNRVTFDGSPNNAGQLCFSAWEDLAYWASGSGCVGVPVTNVVGVVTNIVYSPCAGTAEVQLDAVGGLAHQWPESPTYNASIRVVDFLLRFTRP